MFAHPDDEVFCVGGTFARYCADGAEAMVVSATRGEAGQIRDAQVATRATIGAVREAELRASCDRLGVQHVRCLDHRDGTLSDLDRSVLAAEIADLVEEFAPDVVVTFGPDGGYGHPDHVAISVATTDALTWTGGPLYHTHFPRNRLLLRDHLARWLSGLDTAFRGSDDFVRALSLFAEAAATMRLTGDQVAVRWYPPGVAIIEQGEAPTSLYLILSGEAEVVREQADGAHRQLATVGPGAFFGEQGVAADQPRNAHVIATTTVTCLVLAADEPALYAGRGPDAALVGDGAPSPQSAEPEATTRIDVRDHVDAKVAALAAYRSQFPIDPEMFPPALLAEMFGTEWFVRVLPPRTLETELFAEA